MSKPIHDYRHRTSVLLDFLFGPNDPVVLQKDIVQWLKNRGHPITEAALSNFKNEFQSGESKITIRRIRKYFDLLEEFVCESLDYTFDEQIYQYITIGEPNTLPRPNRNKDLPGFLRQFNQVHYHPGRLLLNQKAELIQRARKEIIELGTRLHGFASYFNSQSDAAFQKHFVDAIARGVNIKCILIDPDSDAAKSYFEHRTEFDSSEHHSISTTQTVIKELKSLKFKLNATDSNGQMDLFTYAHFPYNHFFAVDRHTPEGVIIVSSYLYGLKRAKSPVLIVTKSTNPVLYDIYNNSLEMILKKARKIN